jgi:hypothetical protein
MMVGSFIGRISEMAVKCSDYKKGEAQLKVRLLQAQIWLTCFLAAGAFLSVTLKLAAIFQLLLWG